MLVPHWSNPAWKAWRIATFFTVAALMVCLIGYFVGGNSWLPALYVTVGLNIIANLALLYTAWQLRDRDGNASNSLHH